MSDMDLKDQLTQLASELKRGTLVLCVLACTSQPAYGYSLVQKLEEAGLGAEANTLYPLLRRLEKQGLLQSVWEVGENKPRKYYTRTDAGTALYESLQTQWARIAKGVDRLIMEEKKA